MNGLTTMNIKEKIIQYKPGDILVSMINVSADAYSVSPGDILFCVSLVSDKDSTWDMRCYCFNKEAKINLMFRFDEIESLECFLNNNNQKGSK